VIRDRSLELPAGDLPTSLRLVVIQFGEPSALVLRRRASRWASLAADESGLRSVNGS
jgi:hypothetical protein